MNILNWLNRAYSAYLRRKNLQRAVQLMAVIVVFCTTYALILPAITLESGTICGLTEHSHTEQCYETAAPTECTIPESEGHEHTDECIGTVEKLVCTADHIHEGSCYEYVDGYACGMEETPGHSHAEDSSEPVQVLICGLEEHAHDDSCYPATEPTTQDETVPEETDPAADVETAEDWEASLTAAALTGDWSEDILAIARTQLGYAESKTNYITDEAGLVFGYTRYGQWYGQPYADWSAMFVSFCLHYADIEGIGPDQDCQNWLNALNEAGIYQEAAAYTPVPGDLIFMDWTDDGIADQVGIVETVTAATGESIGTCQVIAGDCDGQVDRMVLDSGYQGILGYAALPEEPEQPGELSHFYISEDGTYTQVDLPEGSSIPAGAELTVTALTEEHEQYEAMAEQIRSAASGAVTSMTLLDISFYDAKGEYLSVSDTAQVSICFPAGAFPTGEVKVFHFVDGVPVELKNVSMNAIATAAEGDTQSTQTLLTFETDGFSVFAVTELFNTSGSASITALTELDGNSYYLVNGGGRYSMLDASGSHNPVGLNKKDFSSSDIFGSLEGSTVWTFDMQADGTFLIKSDSNFYIKMEDTANNVASVTLTEADAAADATPFTIRIINNQVEIGYDGPDGIAHYLNVYQGNTDFLGWKDNGNADAGSRHFLYLADEFTGKKPVVTGLDGEELAIVSYMTYDGYHKAMATTSVKVNTSSDGLTTTAVTRTDVEGDDCVVGSAQVWKFDATDTDGVYYISTQVDGATKYLRLLDSHYAATEANGCGSLTLGDEKQAITVLANGDGTVSLSATVTVATADGTDSVTGYVNLDNTAYNYWTFNQNSDYCKLYLCKKLPIDSSFTITYNDLHTITVNLTDINGQPLFIVPENRTFDATSPAITLDAAFAPEIEGYAFYRAVFDNASIASIAPNNDTSYIIYRTDYVAGNGKLYTRYKNETITLVYVCDETLLTYDLNLPTSSWIDVTPSIPGTYQEIATDATPLYTVTGIDVAGTYKYVANTAGGSGELVSYYRGLNTDKGDALTAENYMAPGSEYKFLGWRTTTADGETVTLAPDAVATTNANGTISVTSGENIYTLASGTQLEGQWQKINDLIQLFINHSNTMLSTQSSVKVQTDSSKYTDRIAIGRIYNADGSNLDFAYASKDHHADIAKGFVTSYDPSSTELQIVLDAVWLPDTNVFLSINGATVDQVNNYAMNYIQTNTNASQEIKIDGATVARSDLDAGYYTLYWYSLKNVGGDAWHMDGILAAEVEPIEIRKTFSGLTEEQAQGILGIGATDDGAYMQFPIYLIDSSGTDKPYKTLKANTTESGVFTYNGKQDGSNIYSWTLQAIQGQAYGFAEENYALDGYTCTSLISVHFLNSSQPIYKYNVTSTLQDTDIFKDLDGATVGRVIFANFYTQTGTGMFSISKVSSLDQTLRLPNAVFTLTKNDDATFSVSQTTNAYGAAHFNNLKPGTYILTETTPPAGYIDPETKPTWTVVVAESDTGVITVTVGGKTVYDSNAGGITNVYPITNAPVNDTLSLTAKFSLTAQELADIKDSYTITVTKSDGPTQTLTLNDANVKENLDGSYTWLLSDMTGDYTITESGYSHPDYKDTVITADMNGTALTATGQGSFAVTLRSDSADAVTLTNTYITQFQLRVNVVDENDRTALEGAKFELYTFDQSAAPGGKAYTYTDGSGTHTVYCLAELPATDEGGLTTYAGLPLGASYVLLQTEATTGYLKAAEPISFTAQPNGTNYHTVTVPNTAKTAAKVSITASVAWDVPAGTTNNPDSVTLYLYKSTDGTTAKLVETATVTATDNWTKVWTKPYADGTADCTYYVAETPPPGYYVSYSAAVETLTVGTTQVGAAPAEGTELARSVTVTNTSGYELPSTGGSGIGWMAPLGLALMMAPWLTQLSTRKKKQQGGVYDS